MVEEDQYCVDISNQVMAARGEFKTGEQGHLSADMQHCVQQPIDQGDAQEARKKVEELMGILDKLLK